MLLSRADSHMAVASSAALAAAGITRDTPDPEVCAALACSACMRVLERWLRPCTSTQHNCPGASSSCECQPASDSQGGTIDRDASGEPSGVLREAAIGLVARLIPPPSPAQLAAALKVRRGCEAYTCAQRAKEIFFVNPFRLSVWPIGLPVVPQNKQHHWRLSYRHLNLYAGCIVVCAIPWRDHRG